MIELDNALWFPDHDTGITDIKDMFSGLLSEETLPRLIRDYNTWCIDMRLCALREVKAIGSSSAQTGRRDSMFLSRLKSSPNYKRNLRTQQSQGKTQLASLTKEATRELHMMLKQYHEGSKTFSSLQKDSANFFEHFYKRVWEAGRKASGLTLYMPDVNPTRKEVDWLQSSIREELTYWQSFMKEVKEGEVLFDDEVDTSDLKPPRRKRTVEERIEMYFIGLDAVFENGRVGGMPNDVLFYWFGPKPGSKGICAGCSYIVERQPFTKSTLPAVPRSGATPCLSNCRHKIVVRKATLQEVDNRQRVLPTRASMVKQLNSFKSGKAKYKVKGKLINPWQK